MTYLVDGPQWVDHQWDECIWWRWYHGGTWSSIDSQPSFITAEEAAMEILEAIPEKGKWQK